MNGRLIVDVITSHGGMIHKKLSCLFRIAFKFRATYQKLYSHFFSKIQPFFHCIGIWKIIDKQVYSRFFQFVKPHIIDLVHRNKRIGMNGQYPFGCQLLLRMKHVREEKNQYYDRKYPHTICLFR